MNNVIFFCLLSFAFHQESKVANLGLYNSISDSDTCISISIRGDKATYSTEDGYISLALNILNNSSEILYLPESFDSYFYMGEEILRSKSSSDLIFHLQKMKNGKYVDYTYPPDNISLQELYEYTGSNIPLEYGQSASYKLAYKLFESMPAGKYRLRVALVYPFTINCAEEWSNWYDFKLKKRKK